MQLSRKVKLYPNQTMTKVLDDLCNYRRYCWNQGLELWNEFYDQRVEMVPASLRKKSQLAIKDKTIKFSKDEQELLDMFQSLSHHIVLNLLVKDKEDWQYQLSSRVLQLTIKDLAQSWSKFFNSQKQKNLKLESLLFVLKRTRNKVLKPTARKLKMVNLY